VGAVSYQLRGGGRKSGKEPRKGEEGGGGLCVREAYKSEFVLRSKGRKFHDGEWDSLYLRGGETTVRAEAGALGGGLH